MTDGSTRIPPAGGIQITIDDLAWRRLIRHPERIVARAAACAGAEASFILTSDHVVRRLNAQHRGRNKPTNVLTFDPPFAGHPGEVVLASGVVAREAKAAKRHPAHHLAHLVIHGALHLQGHDHDHAGAARRMEQREARLMGALRLPNPWTRT